MRSLVSLAALVAMSLPGTVSAQTPDPPDCACLLISSTSLPQIKTGIGSITALGSCTYVPDAGCVVAGSITLTYNGSPTGTPPFVFSGAFFAVPNTGPGVPSQGTNVYSHTPPQPLACDSLGTTRSYLSISGSLSSNPDSLVAFRIWSCHAQ